MDKKWQIEIADFIENLPMPIAEDYYLILGTLVAEKAAWGNKDNFRLPVDRINPESSAYRSLKGILRVLDMRGIVHVYEIKADHDDYPEMPSRDGLISIQDKAILTYDPKAHVTVEGDKFKFCLKILDERLRGKIGKRNLNFDQAQKSLTFTLPDGKQEVFRGSYVGAIDAFFRSQDRIIHKNVLRGAIAKYSQGEPDDKKDISEWKSNLRRNHKRFFKYYEIRPEGDYYRLVRILD